MFTADNFVTLGMLILLQTVLGFDNLLYISIESRRAPEDKQTFVRQIGIGIAIFLRITLLYVMIRLIDVFEKITLFEIHSSVFECKINLHSFVVIVGGGFILYTAVKEIWHMISIEEHEKAEKKEPASLGKVITMIIIMNLVFSFDSILSAIALTDVFWVMAAAIIIGGLLMIWLSDKVTNFLKKNRMYEVLGLFILFIVGIMLVTEGGELGHIIIAGNEVHHMNKSTFYFVISILIITDLVQSRYQKKLSLTKENTSSPTEH